MGAKERSFGRAMVLIETGGVIAAALVTTDRCKTDSGDGTIVDSGYYPLECSRVEVADGSITSMTRLTPSEIKELPSPFPPDIVCVKIGTGRIIG